MSNGGNTIECYERRYRVKTPGGIVVDVESTTLLSERMTRALLEEDNDIDSFFAHHKITGIRQLVAAPVKNRQESKVVTNINAKKRILSPMMRLNEMLKMKGEFTRRDYEQHIFNEHKTKIERHTAHKDIKDAIGISRVELIKGKSGRLMKYRVLDPANVDENLYAILLRDRRVQMDALH